MAQKKLLQLDGNNSVQYILTIEEEDKFIQESNKINVSDLNFHPKLEVIKNFEIFYQQVSSLEDFVNSPNFKKITQYVRNPHMIQIPAQLAHENFQKLISTTNKKTKKWCKEEKQLLFWVVLTYSSLNQIAAHQLSAENWREVSKLIYNRNAHQCQQKWEQNLNICLADSPWTLEEDEELFKIINEYLCNGLKCKWNQISKSLQKRCNTTFSKQPKQCRERWINKLNPHLQNMAWTKDEEIQLLKLILLVGTKWSVISTLYDNRRSESQLKNKYHNLLSKQLNFDECNINPIAYDKISKIRLEFSLKHGFSSYFDQINHFEWRKIIILIKNLRCQIFLEKGLLEEIKKIQLDDQFIINEFSAIENQQNLKSPNQQKLAVKPLKEEFFSNRGSQIILIKNNTLYIVPEQLKRSFNVHPNKISPQQEVIGEIIEKKVKCDQNGSINPMNGGDQKQMMNVSLLIKSNVSTNPNRMISSQEYLNQQQCMIAFQNGRFGAYQPQFSNFLLQDNTKAPNMSFSLNSQALNNQTNQSQLIRSQNGEVKVLNSQTAAKPEKPNKNYHSFLDSINYFDSDGEDKGINDI